jgi:hypothetical protein
MRLWGVCSVVLVLFLSLVETGDALYAPPIAPPQTFSGSGNLNVGSIAVPTESVLTWSCPGCGNANFAIHTADYSQLWVNELFKTSGQATMEPGTYENVEVEGSDFQEHLSWTFTVTPLEQRLPITSIQLVVSPHHGHTYRHPGFTNFEVLTAPEPAAFMTIDLHYGRENLGQLAWKPPYSAQQREESRSGYVEWDCHFPNEAITYVAGARGETGPTMTATGTFRALISAKWCRFARKREIAVNRRRGEEEARARREEREEQARHNREKAEHERAEHERFESNCRALGGTPVTIHLSTGSARVCRGPNGGLIPVPT